MKIGEKLVCIKNYIDKGSDYIVEFRKDQIYTIIEIEDDSIIRMKGDVKYNHHGVTYLSHAFSIKKKS